MWRKGNRTIVFNFHGLGELKPCGQDDPDDYQLTADQFAEILDVLKTRPWVRITFDDSLESDVAIALPLLRRAGVRAEFFILAGKLDQPGHLSRESVAELVKAGMLIGSHGMDHRDWTMIDDIGLRTELVEARQRIADVASQAVRSVACPFGAYDRRVLAALRKQGFSRVYTSDGGYAYDRRWLQPRNTVKAHHDARTVAAIADHGWSFSQRIVQGTKRLYKSLR